MKFRDYLKETYGGLDVLVNNAAIAFKVIKCNIIIYLFYRKQLTRILKFQSAATEPFGVQAEETVRVNYFSLRRVCDALYPLLRPHARVVHVSSSSGRLCNISGKALKQKLSDPNLTEAELDEIMRDFVK